VAGDFADKSAAPGGTGRRLVLAAIGLAVAGAGVVLARNGGFREQVAESAKALGDEIAGR
jgi:hypothetical protein